MAERKREYYNYSASYYNNSSSALAPLPEPDLPVRKTKKKRKAYRGTRTVTQDATDKSSRPSVLIGVVMVFIAAAAFLSILANSFAAVQGIENNQLRSELQAMQMRTSELNTLAATSVDIEEVERIARTRLGMGEPQIHQIRHIYVPWQNYIPSLPGHDYANENIDTEQYMAETSIFSDLFNIVNTFSRD